MKWNWEIVCQQSLRHVKKAKRKKKFKMGSSFLIENDTGEIYWVTKREASRDCWTGPTDGKYGLFPERRLVRKSSLKIIFSSFKSLGFWFTLDLFNLSKYNSILEEFYSLLKTKSKSLKVFENAFIHYEDNLVVYKFY